MSQDDYQPLASIGSLSGARNFEQIGLALDALRGLLAGATAPARTFAYMLWADTTAGQLKMRNAANDGWIVLWSLGAAPVSPVPFFKATADSPVTIDQPGTYYCDASAGPMTLNLPDCATSVGWYVATVKTDATANGVTLARAGSDTIEGLTSLLANAQYVKTAVMSPGGGTVWYKAPGV